MSLKIELSRPLVFFDLETTGTRPESDRIVEISVLKLNVDGTSQTITRLVNPGMPIPPGASEVHGITDADVAEAPQFMQLARNLYNYLENCDLAGYNLARFDVPLLVNEFRRAGLEFSLADRKIVDVYTIFCKLFPRTLSGAYEFFCGAKLEDAHSAEADTRATMEVLQGQLDKFPGLPRDVAGLAEYSDNRDPDALDSSNRFKWSGETVIVNFGKHSGRELKDIAVNEPGFLRWIIRSDFADEVKQIAEAALVGKFPERAAKAQERPDGDA